MTYMTSFRLAGLLMAAAMMASACGSDSTAAIDEPADGTATTATTANTSASTVAPAAAITTTTTSASTTPAPSYSTTAPSELETVALSPVMMDDIGVVSVAPVDWDETPDGTFTSLDGAVLRFGATRTWTAPSPHLFGLELVDRQRVGSRWWDIYGVETPQAAALVALTGDELMQYSVELVAPADDVERYIDSVAAPALDAFDLIKPIRGTGELEAATVAIDGRVVAYASGGSGQPTIVFESGWADGMSVWASVGDAAAEFGNVFAYDRPGLGGSEPSGRPRDGAEIVEELRTVLDVTGHQPPYVLVGHSLGGLYMELFARSHPDEVAGLVLVDSSIVGQTELCIEEFGLAECDPFSDEMIAELPEPHRAEAVGFEPTEQQLRTAPAFGPIPTVLLAAEKSEGVPNHDEWWVELAREQATALDATFVLAQGSSHFLQNDRPDLVLQAIQDVIEQHQSR